MHFFLVIKKIMPIFAFGKMKQSNRPGEFLEKIQSYGNAELHIKAHQSQLQD